MNAIPKNKEVRIKWNKNKKNNLQNTAKKTEQLLLQTETVDQISPCQHVCSISEVNISVPSSSVNMHKTNSVNNTCIKKSILKRTKWEWYSKTDKTQLINTFIYSFIFSVKQKSLPVFGWLPKLYSKLTQILFLHLLSSI